MNPSEIKCEICEEEEDATLFSAKGDQRLKTAIGPEFVSVDQALEGKVKSHKTSKLVNVVQGFKDESSATSFCVEWLSRH